MRKAPKKLRKQLAVLRDLLEVLGYDTVFCLCKLDDELGNTGTSSSDITRLNFWLKTSIRTFFAQVEGLTYAMRWSAIKAAEEGHIKLEPKEVAQLQERKYDRATGTLGKSYRGRFEDNFKNSFRYLPRVFGSDWSLQLQGAGWEKFCRIAAFRNGFTHPKEKTQLFRGAAGEDLHGAVTWFDNNFRALLREIGSRLGKEINLQSSEPAELSEHAKTKLALISPPPDRFHDASALLRETEFMALLREDENTAYDIFRNGASLQSGRLYFDGLSSPGARLYARTLFTDIEAIGYLAQRVLSDSAAKGEISFSDEEQELLNTKDLTLKIASYAEMFSHKFGHGRVIDKTGRTWQAFSKFSEFRDQITHPKNPDDLCFSIEILEVMGDALEWYMQLLDTLELSDRYVNLACS